MESRDPESCLSTYLRDVLREKFEKFNELYNAVCAHEEGKPVNVSSHHTCPACGNNTVTRYGYLSGGSFLDSEELYLYDIMSCGVCGWKQVSNIPLSLLIRYSDDGRIPEKGYIYRTEDGLMITVCSPLEGCALEDVRWDDLGSAGISVSGGKLEVNFFSKKMMESVLYFQTGGKSCTLGNIVENVPSCGKDAMTRWKKKNDTISVYIGPPLRDEEDFLNIPPYYEVWVLEDSDLRDKLEIYSFSRNF